MYICKEHEELLQHCTAIIECVCGDNKVGHGTSFFIKTNSSKILLMTNTHVVIEGEVINILLTITKNGIKTNNVYELDFKDTLITHPEYDVCVIDITDIYEDITEDDGNINIKFIGENQILTNYDNMNLLQDVIMVGYPSGLFDAYNNAPIIRTGRTATNIQNRFDNSEIFQIDVASVKGSSGSPVFSANDNGELSLIGIDAKCYNHNTKVHEEHKNPNSRVVGYVDVPNHIGTIINSKVIYELIQSIHA